MKEQTGSTGQFFMAFAALERLDAAVRVDVRHQGRFQAECFVAHVAL